MILITPKIMPKIFIIDKVSLKKKIPVRMINIKFNIVNIDIAFDKNSYFREYAQIAVPRVYRSIPTMIRYFLFSIDHFLKYISAIVSKTTASSIKRVKMILGFMEFSIDIKLIVSREKI
ncbi:MAG: hypothetical protein WCV55_02045 [Candidatus Paceibacterota bacterium]